MLLGAACGPRAVGCPPLAYANTYLQRQLKFSSQHSIPFHSMPTVQCQEVLIQSTAKYMVKSDERVNIIIEPEPKRHDKTMLMNN